MCFVPAERPAARYQHALKQTVAVKKAAVENRNHGAFFRDKFAVEKYNHIWEGTGAGRLRGSLQRREKPAGFGHGFLVFCLGHGIRHDARADVKMNRAPAGKRRCGWRCSTGFRD